MNAIVDFIFWFVMAAVFVSLLFMPGGIFVLAGLALIFIIMLPFIMIPLIYVGAMEAAFKKMEKEE